MDVIQSCLSRCWPFSLREAQCGSRNLGAGMTQISDDQELVIFQDGTQVTLTLLETGIRVLISQRSPGPFSRNYVEVVPFLRVLFCRVKNAAGRSILELSYLSAVTRTLALRQVFGDVTPIQGTEILRWVANIQMKAYKDITPKRRFLVLINPHSGQGKAKKIWKETVEPIFAAAGCIVHVQHTGPVSSPTNAANIARNVDLSAYDALVPVSGDGIGNELINGLASRPDALSALRMPIAPIPAGSGNALSVNIMGPDKVTDVAYAALNAIKGQPMPLDICSVTQGDTRIYSFLSQVIGLMADLDMGTEWIRWAGDVRFVLGFLYGALAGVRYDVEITLKIVESDKRRMVDDYNAHQQTLRPWEAQTPALAARMPPLAFGTTDSPFPLGVTHDRLEAPLEPGWHTFRTSVQFIMAGKLPWLARDSLAFPLAQDDGFIDVVMVPPRSTLASLKTVDGQKDGTWLRQSDFVYCKVEAYRCTPLERSGYISIDGESIEYKPFQVESHGRLGRIMSMDTRWKGLERFVL
ncbi:DAGKc domain-containing protein [Mycena venus]|uniref:DAGKc domain-containing protein n=1 Tax=Mycena venus TaxID=2733690 RepID=A0A8H6XMW2_9AGAR|nr:DAGKc domain-containing protein [Mycena venus]